MARSDGLNPATWLHLHLSSFSSYSSVWTSIRADVIAPVLNVAIVTCVVMSFMLMLEAVYMSSVSLVVKVFGLSPERRYRWEPVGLTDTCQDGEKGKKGETDTCGDVEKGKEGESDTWRFPMVLVQIPMFNEKEVYKLSIRAACALTWPADQIIIQILDDSTDLTIKNLVETECNEMARKGTNIKYEVRSNRKGYKAGALKKGMERNYAQKCDFVAIFDADFQPDSDFLLKTVPFLVHNPKLGLVQTRWEFVNYKVSIMTQIQRMSLDYHFKVEQESGSATFSFFGFNGTAGVWRINTINEAGGWKDRTTVEDMDLAVRASLKGWKFLYVGDIRVKSELPSTFNAYRHQQHRWTCGAANLFRKMGWDIAINKEVSLLKKIHVLYSFFFIRRVIAPLVTFCFYCVVIPLAVTVPEVSVPVWGLVYIPTTITILNAVRNPSSLHLMPLWILFENVMALHRMRAAMIGLLETSSVNTWVVTEKKGDIFGDNKSDLEVPLLEPTHVKCAERIYVLELGLAVFLLTCASYNLLFGNDYYYVYIYLQAIAFIIMGFGFVGTPNSNS